MTTLESLIVRANTAYRAGTPIMTDKDYDKLIERLKIEKPDSELLKKGIIEKGGKERLPVQMPSLNKAHSIKDIKNWLERIGCSINENLVLTPKMDGASLLEKRGEHLGIGAWTRGDGEYGFNVLSHYSNLFQVNMSNREDCYFIGETIISKTCFQMYFENEYSNARNMVASLFNTVEPQKGKLAEVFFLRHGYIRAESTVGFDKTYQLSVCNHYNRVQIPFKVVNFLDLSEKYLDDLFRKWAKEFDFEIDGIVIDINNSGIREEVGYHSNGNPNYAIAYKGGWEEVKETVVKDIRWQISRHGLLKPVAEIEPVVLEGATISNVTLYNAKYVIDNGINEGVRIKLRRSGGVIPQIVEVINSCEYFEDGFNEYINENFGPFEWDKNGVEIYLLNKTREQVIKEITHFFVTIGVDGLKENSIEAFYNAGYNNIFKIANLSFTQILTIAGFGEKTGLYISMKIKECLTNISLYKFQAASGFFEGMGEKTLREVDFFIDPSFLDKDSYYNEIKTKLLAKPGFGEIIVSSYLRQIYEFYKFYFTFKEIYSDLSVIFPSGGIKKDERLKGSKIVFTGFRDKELEEKIFKLGGEVSTSVSKQTTLVVAANLGSISAKIQQAKKLYIDIWRLEEFKETYNL